jgi:hypothetical protein
MQEQVVETSLEVWMGPGTWRLIKQKEYETFPVPQNCA